MNAPTLYKDHRSDGWPFCPHCGEDELYSLEVPATVSTIVGCYRCGWKPSRPCIKCGSTNADMAEPAGVCLDVYGCAARRANATLATLSSGSDVRKRGKRGTSPIVSLEKSAVPTGSGDASPYLVGAPVSRPSPVTAPDSGKSGDQTSVWTEAITSALLVWRRSEQVSGILVSANLTTRAGTDAALSEAWSSSRGETLAALLVPERKAGHAHLHGLALYADDDQASRFAARYTELAGDSGGEHACDLRPVPSFAAFLRTGQTSVAWARKSLVDDVRGVLAHAFGETRRKRACGAVTGAPWAFGLFAVAVRESRITNTRACACGCGRSLAGRRPHATAFDGSCRKRILRRSPATLPLTRAEKRGTASTVSTLESCADLAALGHATRVPVADPRSFAGPTSESPAPESAALPREIDRNGAAGFGGGSAADSGVGPSPSRVGSPGLALLRVGVVVTPLAGGPTFAVENGADR